MEPAPGRERRHPGAERRQLRQHPPAGRHPLAARPHHRAADPGAEARRPAQVTGCQGGAVRRRPKWRARRAQLVLPARGPAGGVRAAAQPAAADAQPRQELFLLPGERGRPRGAGARRPAQAPHGRHGRAGRGGIELMSDTFFSGAPHWAWLIILYFFVGGIAGGACLLAAVVDWFGGPEDRPVVRTGYNVAAWGAILSGALLTIDLGRPLRFWHMLFQSANVPALMFKGWSPISFGAWAILLFGLFAVLSALGGMAEEGRFHHPALRPGGRAARGGVAEGGGGGDGVLGCVNVCYPG